MQFITFIRMEWKGYTFCASRVSPPKGLVVCEALSLDDKHHHVFNGSFIDNGLDPRYGSLDPPLPPSYPGFPVPTMYASNVGDY